MTYQNPILSGFYPDPTMCKVGKDYFLATSSFEYFPGVPLFHSTDLIHWKQIGHCLTRKSQLYLNGIESSEGIFAPTLRYHNGTFYMITTVVGGCGHFYVTTDNPYGEWSDPIYVEGEGFDPDLFFDSNGKVYFTRQNPRREGIIQFEIDITTGALLDSGTVLWKGYQDIQCEGPHIYYKDDWYYLLTAEGGTHKGHMITIARSRSVSGPYEGCPHNPILSHRGCPEKPIQATGHGDLIEATDGSWWIVFLGIRQVGNWLCGVGHHLGRETSLAPVEWVDGWPVVNNGQPVTEIMELDRFEALRQPVGEVLPQSATLPHSKASARSATLQKLEIPNAGYRDTFDTPALHTRWNFRGNPDPKGCSLTYRQGWLTLQCSADTLDTPLCRGFVGVRQQHFTCSVATLVELEALSLESATSLAAVAHPVSAASLTSAASPATAMPLTGVAHPVSEEFSPIASSPVSARSFTSVAHPDTAPHPAAARPQKAGLVVLMNERHYYAMGIRVSKQGKELFLQKQVGDIKTLYAIPWHGQTATLQIDATPDMYTFRYIDKHGTKKTLGTGLTHYLSSEVAGGFTGVYFGLFATSSKELLDSEPVCVRDGLGTAYFNWFSYEPFCGKP